MAETPHERVLAAHSEILAAAKQRSLEVVPLRGEELKRERRTVTGWVRGVGARHQQEFLEFCLTRMNGTRDDLVADRFTNQVGVPIFERWMDITDGAQARTGMATLASAIESKKFHAALTRLGRVPSS